MHPFSPDYRPSPSSSPSPQEFNHSSAHVAVGGLGAVCIDAITTVCTLGVYHVFMNEATSHCGITVTFCVIIGLYGFY